MLTNMRVRFREWRHAFAQSLQQHWPFTLYRRLRTQLGARTVFPPYTQPCPEPLKVDGFDFDRIGAVEGELVHVDGGRKAKKITAVVRNEGGYLVEVVMTDRRLVKEFRWSARRGAHVDFEVEVRPGRSTAPEGSELVDGVELVAHRFGVNHRPGSLAGDRGVSLQLVGVLHHVYLDDRKRTILVLTQPLGGVAGPAVFHVLLGDADQGWKGRLTPGSLLLLRGYLSQERYDPCLRIPTSNGLDWLTMWQPATGEVDRDERALLHAA